MVFETCSEMDEAYLLSRKYERRTYNCLHFAIEVWRGLTKEDLGERMRDVLASDNLDGLRRDHLRGFRRIERPEPDVPCVVFFYHPLRRPHVGVMYRDRVWHLQEQGGCCVGLDFARLGFERVHFYVSKNHHRHSKRV